MAEFVVGLTGGIASGKSAVGSLFEQLGIIVADADLAARHVVAPGQPALVEIAAAFGASMLLADGSLDRALLRKHVFADPVARQALEKITHPRIRLLLLAQCEEAASAYAVVAIPLLAEAGSSTGYPWIQRVLVVDAPQKLQRERLMRRDGIDAGLAERMLASQASREQRLALATDVIVNDAGLEALHAPVERLDRLYRRIARN